MSMTGSYPKAEILTGPERRRRWSVAEKLAMAGVHRAPAVLPGWRGFFAASPALPREPCALSHPL